LEIVNLESVFSFEMSLDFTTNESEVDPGVGFQRTVLDRQAVGQRLAFIPEGFELSNIA
jgi:hypothetical protein